MNWYWLAIMVAGGLGLVFIAGYVALRSTVAGRRFLRLPRARKVRFVRVLLQAGQLGWAGRVVVLLLLGYLLLPFDLIPDFIPVLGLADDVAVFVALVSLLLLVVPRARLEVAFSEAEGGGQSDGRKGDEGP